MNKDEIMKMEAGEEMDKAIAEQVMGWHVVICPDGYKFWGDKDDKFEYGMNQSDNGYEDDEDFYILHWHPSSNMLAAWEVAEKLLNSVWIEVKWDGKMAEVCFDDSHDGFEANAPTVPLAICRAALLAILEKK